MTICVRCQNDRPHKARGFCDSCYVTVFRNKIKHRDYERKRRIAHPEAVRKANILAGRKRRLKKRQQYDAFMNPLKIKCVKCGYQRCKFALEFHHIDSSQKDYPVNIDTWTRLPLKMPVVEKAKLLLDEMKKCILLCSNCHRELEAKMWSIEELNVRV